MFKFQNMNKQEFKVIERLYHYTTFCGAVKIIASKRLRYGKFEKANDIHESYHPLFYGKNINEENIRNELSKYRYISFSQDKDKHYGFALASMWGHYAEGGKGVCLVFDKKAVLKSLDAETTARKITYSTRFDGSIVVDEVVEKYFTQKKYATFFKKSADWKNEQEFRLLKKISKEEESYLPVENSLIAVIVNFADDISSNDTVLNSASAVALRNLLPIEIPLLELGFWNGKPNLRCQGCDEEWFPCKNTKIDYEAIQNV